MSGEENCDVGVLGIVTFGLNDFAINLIARGKKARLSQRALQDIKKTCIANIRNIDPTGTLIKQDSELFELAITRFVNLVDAAITKGLGN